VNAEMTAKNDLLTNLNGVLQNLLNSTQIATIFLDESLRIKNFAPGMADIFSVRASDRGRPLTDIVSLLAYDDLRRDVAKVSRELTVLERELELHDRGSSFTMRIRPYQTIERVIDGVVITFIDVTERKKAEEAKHISERRFTACGLACVLFRGHQKMIPPARGDRAERIGRHDEQRPERAFRRPYASVPSTRPSCARCHSKHARPESLPPRNREMSGVRKAFKTVVLNAG
jgi:PAS domain S-box-containing protein